MKQKKSASILKKFLLFNFTVFSVLGIFTIIYLEAIQPNLVKNRTINHKVIISNTVDNFERLSIDFTKEGIRTFLLSARFLFQSLDRVQFYDIRGNLIGDTNILDLDQSVFSRSDFIIEETIDGKSITPEIQERLEEEEKDNIKEIILNQYIDQPITIDETIKNDYFVSTLSKVNINKKDIGFIVVSEQANEIITAVKERKAFIVRTMIAVAIVILIFSLFLNKYILKPISLLVKFSEAIKKKSNQNIDIKKVFVRDDEIGKLTVSIDEMTKELQQRTNRAETFSNDLAHEIRNPLASLKSASELLDKTTEKNESEKLLKIINHDVERIERLITDYSQMLKDEASLSREKMSKINLIDIINSVVEDFKQDLINQNKKIEINIKDKINTKNGYYIFGIGNRLEQVIANLLDNSISFCKEGENIFVNISYTVDKKILVKIIDDGQGFKEKDTSKIFKRFYSNRPDKFGEHSGLGLNIVKNLVDLHDGEIVASNRLDRDGAIVEIRFPSV